MAADMLTALIPDLEAKFLRYCVADATGTKLLNLAGFKYLLKSCPGLDLPDEQIPALFAVGAGLASGAQVSRTFKLTFDDFMTAITHIAVDKYGSSDPENSLLSCVLECMVPYRLDEPAFAAALQRATGPENAGQTSSPGKKAATTPVKPASPRALAPSSASSLSLLAVQVPSTNSSSSLVAQMAAGIVVRTVQEMQGSGSYFAGPRTEAVGGRLPPSPQPSAAVQHRSPASTSTSASRPTDLPTFLSSLRLEAFLATLHDFGAESLDDLLDVTDDELHSLGLKPLQRRRLREALLAHVHSISTQAQPAGYDNMDLDPHVQDARSSPSPDTQRPQRSAAAPMPTAEPPRPSSMARIDQAHGHGVVPAGSTSTAGSEGPVFFPPAPAPIPIQASLVEAAVWDEYATREGYLYYHCAASGVTQWSKPGEGAGVRVRLIGERKAAAAQVAADVEARVSTALAALGLTARAAGGAKAVQEEVQGQSPTGGAADAGAGSPAPLRFREAQAGLADDARRYGIAYNSYRGMVEAGAGDTGGNGGLRTLDHTAAIVRVKSPGLWEAVHGPGMGGAQSRSTSPVPSSRTNPYSVRGRNRAGSPGRTSVAGDAGPLRDAPMKVTSTYARAAVLARHAATASVSSSLPDSPPASAAGPGPGSGAGTGMEGDGRSVKWGGSANGGGYMSHPATPSSTALASKASRLALARTVAADVRTLASAESAAELYPEVYDTMPHMDVATFDAIARAHTLANPRKMGYADPRPDIRPLTRGGASVDHVVGRVEFSNKGPDGKATAVFAGSLRQHLYTPNADPNTARSGAEMETSWGGDKQAPSTTASGYAFRHAAALSAWTGAGSVYDRLTDHRGFTGVHRARFDADGRGRGIAGRDLSYDMNAIRESIPDAGQGAPYLMDNQRSAYAPPSRASSPKR